MLYRLWRAGRIAPIGLGEAVAAVWIHNRSPVSGLSMSRWVEMYLAAGYIAQCVDVRRDGERVKPRYEHIHFDGQPSHPLTLWRGTSIRAGGRGMSWTLHVGEAEEFARGLPMLDEAVPAVFQTTVPGRAVLAVFCDEREQEVVVNPHMLRGRATPQLVDHDALQARLRDAAAAAVERRRRLSEMAIAAGPEPPGEPSPGGGAT